MAVIVNDRARDYSPAPVQPTGAFTLVETVTLAAAPQNDVVLIGKLADGISVVDGHVQFEALGSNTAIELGLYSKLDGTVVDADRLLKSTVTTAAGRADLNGGADVSFRNDSGADLYIGLKVAGTDAATGKVRVSLLLTREQTNQG